MIPPLGLAESLYNIIQDLIFKISRVLNLNATNMTFSTSQPVQITSEEIRITDKDSRGDLDGVLIQGKIIQLTRGFIEGIIVPSDPDAPVVDTGRLYFRDNGSGKTQLVVRFPTGAVQIISTEP